VELLIDSGAHGVRYFNLGCACILVCRSQVGCGAGVLGENVGVGFQFRQRQNVGFVGAPDVLVWQPARGARRNNAGHGLEWIASVRNTYIRIIGDKPKQFQ